MTTTTGKSSSRVQTERSTVSISDFAAEIEELSGSSESINGIIHGDSNVGKTWLAATCPGRTFWLVCEPGYKSAARRGGIGYGRRISDTATALTAIDWLKGKNKAGQRRYEALDWIVLDGLSTMEKRFRLGYAAEAFDVSGGTKRTHRNLPDKPDYFNTQNFLLSWIPQLVDLPVNFLITAHTYKTEDGDGDPIAYPGIQGVKGETSNAISGLMDFTGYYEAKRYKSKRTGDARLVRRLWFETPPDREVRYICGDKFDCLGPYMDFPTIPDMLDKIAA